MVVASMNVQRGPIPKDRLAFDIDGVVADIMTTFLTLARERYNQGHHLRYEHITTFSLEECLDLPAWIIDESSGNSSTGPMNWQWRPSPKPCRS